jgi:hypothetical protein
VKKTNIFSKPLLRLKENQLRETLLATSLVQLSVGVLFLLRLEPFRHLFFQWGYDPYPAPLEGYQEMFFAVRYSFVFGAGGLIFYLGRRYPQGVSTGFKWLMGIWIVTFFATFYRSFLIFRPSVFSGSSLPDKNETQFDIIYFLAEPMALASIFSIFSLWLHNHLMKGKEDRMITNRAAWKAALGFFLGSIMTPILFVVGVVLAISLVTTGIALIRHEI